MEPEKQCVIHPTSIWARSSHSRLNCHLPALYDFEGHSYCVLHLPDDAKGQTTDFNAVIKQKLDSQDNDFGFVYFPEKFELSRNHTFTEQVSFHHATFMKAALFWDANFEKDAFFRDATFKGEASFSFAKFSGWTNFHHTQFFGSADFMHAEFTESAWFNDCAFGHSVTFEGARFHKRADFNITGIDEENSLKNQFQSIPEAKFSQAVFEDDASFRKSMFTKVEFFRTRFDKEADFWAVEIQNEADFHIATFHQTANFTHIVLHEKAELNFRQTIFKDAVYFDNRDYGDDFVESTLVFADAIAEHPEKVRFHSIGLRPHWFLNFDCSKVDFTNTYWLNSRGTRKEVQEEIKAIADQKWSWGRERVRWDDAHRLLTYTYSQLAQNYENTQRYGPSSRFRRAALETQTLLRKKFQVLWMQEEFFAWEFVKNLAAHLKYAPFDLAHFLYRHSSFYGESSIRALVVLFVIVASVAIILAIPLSTFKDGQYLSFWESILYSLRLMVLQRPEPIPESILAKTTTTIGGILAPVQFALLALALRRKFMR